MIVAIAFALVLANVIIILNLYITNYLQSDGYRIANGMIAGGDFVTFYQAGALIKDEPGKLYDFDYYISKQQEFYKLHGVKGGALIFAYPPLVAHIFSLLPRDTLLEAYLSWTLISLILFFGSLVLIMRIIGAPWKTILIASFAGLGFYGFSLSCVAAGQTSAIGTAIFALFFLLYQKGRNILAGLILSFSYYKPPLFVGLVLVLIFSRNWKVLSGFLVGGFILILLTISNFGYENFTHYISTISHYRYGQVIFGTSTLSIEKGVGLLAAIEGLKLFSSSTAQEIILIFMCLISLFLGTFLFRKSIAPCQSTHNKEELMILFTIIISCSLMFSLQMLVYDLSILFPFAATSAYIIFRNSLKGPAVFSFVIAIIALYYNFNFRGVPVGELTIKVTTLAWMLMTISLFIIFILDIQKDKIQLR